MLTKSKKANFSPEGAASSMGVMAALVAGIYAALSVATPASNSGLTPSTPGNRPQTGEKISPPAPEASVRLSIDFEGVIAFDKQTAESMLRQALETKHAQLSAVFPQAPTEIEIVVSSDLAAHREVALRPELNPDLPNGFVPLIFGSNLPSKIHLYLGRIDNLTGFNRQILPIAEHELVHSFQFSNSSPDVIIEALPLWYIEGQAEFYTNPLNYKPFAKKDFPTIDTLEAVFRNPDANAGKENRKSTAAYGAAKYFYEQLHKRHGEEAMLSWLISVPMPPETIAQLYLEEMPR